MTGGILEMPISTRPSQYAVRSPPNENCKYFEVREAGRLYDRLTWSLIRFRIMVISRFTNIAVPISCATVRPDGEVLVKRSLACRIEGTTSKIDAPISREFDIHYFF